MVGMDGKISSDALFHLFLFVAEHVGIVAGPVEAGVWLDEVSIFVFVSVDGGTDVREFREEIH